MATRNGIRDRSAAVSILIPTKDRPHFLLALLDYYKSRDFAGPILIGDSSSSANWKATQNYIEGELGGLHIEHLHLPGKPAGLATKCLMERVSTDYALFLPDDDYAIPAAMAKCAEFLDNNPTFSAAHGAALMLSVAVNDRTVEFGNKKEYGLPVWEQERASERVEAAFSNYLVSTNCVCRSWVLRKVLDAVPAKADAHFNKAFYDELMFIAVMAAYGKVRGLRIPYLIRLDHGERGQLFPSSYDWITSESWYPSQKDFVDKVAGAIQESDSVTYPEARASANTALASYLRAISGRPRAGALWALARLVKRSVPAIRSLRRMHLWGNNSEFERVVEVLSRRLVHHRHSGIA